MIGEEIEEGDQYWGNFLLLLSILDYCMAPIVSKDWAAYLRMIIQDHHQISNRLRDLVLEHYKSLANTIEA